MQTITTFGLDIAKSVFQIHGIDAGGQVIVRRQLKRRHVVTFFEMLSPCLVGIEACASAHHWSRELQALGHTIRLMPPAYVKPYVKRQKNDATDAEAICEAVTRRREARLVEISTFTTGDDRIRALTTAPRIKPTSIFLRSARRPNPGRRSTYRRGTIVQTTGTGSHRHCLPLR
jgi:transposase